MRRAQGLPGRVSGDDTGASVVEYSLVVVAIAAVLVLALLALGRIVGGQFGTLDCWTATGCAQSMPATQSPAPAATAPAQQAGIPSSAYAGSENGNGNQLCNQSGNGNNKGQGQGSCK